MPAQAASVRRFRATIEGSENGRAFLFLPFDPAEVWGTRERYHVTGTIDGCKVRGALGRSARGYLLTLGAAYRRGAGLGVGDEVSVELAVEGPQREGLAPDLAAALDADPEAGRFFDALATFYRKGYLRWVDATKKRPEVRAERVAELVQLLKAGHKERPR
jgi:Bacteriocin-protection, YdeI or OmpD-Associated/Domain of unknown function (DUF1905)